MLSGISCNIDATRIPDQGTLKVAMGDLRFLKKQYLVA